MSLQLFSPLGQEVINIFGLLPGSRQSQQWHVGDSQVGNAPLLPFIPVPQDAENHDEEEDGEKSRKPSKVAAALVLISVQGAEGFLQRAGLPGTPLDFRSGWVCDSHCHRDLSGFSFSF